MKSVFRMVFSLALAASFAASAQNTYHVRTDGGDTSQCTGLANTAYPGSGTAQPCAWNHPFQALPPGGAARIAGGDTLVIHAGSYKMGYGAPGAEGCDAGGSFDCVMAPVPSGPDASHPTRIVGENYASGCSAMPELWGSERPWYILNLTDSSNVEVACLDITDHSNCIEGHNQSGLPCTGCTVACQRDTPPYGDWASVGIYAEDSSRVSLRDLNVHGLASTGIWAGRLSDWTLERVKIIANGGAGWNGDIGADSSSNSGDMIFRNVEIAWNGCSEAYPAKTITMNTCWGQQAGGYGDGLGTARSGGHWILEDCLFHHNTSDGLDLLYLDSTASIEVRGLISEGNAGNQLKTAGNAVVENSLLIGNCAYFSGQPLMQEGDQCRAMGSAFSVDLHRGSHVTLTNTTITGQGDCLMDIGCNDSYPDDPDPNCDGSEGVTAHNTLFYGNTDWRQNWENTCLYWYDNTLLPSDPASLDYNLVWQAKDDPCPGTHDVCGQEPLVQDASLGSFDGHLIAGSPAINKGTNAGAPSVDIEGYPRDNPPDIGAYEYRGSTGCTLSCTATAPASVQVNAAASFTATATPINCTGSVTYHWDFGDGPSGSGASVTHTYTSTGVFEWTLSAQVQSAECTKTGTITVNPAVAPPVIASVVKASSPFRLKVSGSNLQSGLQVFIGSDTTPWPNVVYKSSALILLKSGSALKARFPVGQAVGIKVVNPDGGQANTTYTRP